MATQEKRVVCSSKFPCNSNLVELINWPKIYSLSKFICFAIFITSLASLYINLILCQPISIINEDNKNGHLDDRRHTNDVHVLSKRDSVNNTKATGNGASVFHSMCQIYNYSKPAGYQYVTCGSGDWSALANTNVELAETIVAIHLNSMKQFVFIPSVFSKICRTVKYLTIKNIPLSDKPFTLDPFRCQELKEMVSLTEISLNRVGSTTGFMDNILNLLPVIRSVRIIQSDIWFLRSCFFRAKSITTVILTEDSINFLYPDAFAEMDSLEKVDLSYNSLSFLHSSTFRKCPRLKYISLAYNRLEYLQSGIFSKLEKLSVLRIDNNNWIQMDYNVLPLYPLGVSLMNLSIDATDKGSLVSLGNLRALRFLYITYPSINVTKTNNYNINIAYPCSINPALKKTKYTTFNSAGICGCGLAPLKSWLPQNSSEIRCLDLHKNALIPLYELQTQKCICNHNSNLTSPLEFSKFCNVSEYGAGAAERLKMENESHTYRIIQAYSWPNNTLNISCRYLDYPSLQKMLQGYYYKTSTSNGNRTVTLNSLRIYRFVGINLTDNESNLNGLLVNATSNKSENYYPVTLSLINCDIASLKSKLNNTRLERLGILDLGTNRISNISKDGYKFPPTLKVLILSNNLLTYIATSYFTELSALVVLDLNSNYIVTIEKMAFFYLSSLEVLRLESNKISVVTFELPLKLAVLYVNNNFITFVPEGWIYRDLHYLIIYANSLDCYCNLKTYIQKLTARAGTKSESHPLGMALENTLCTYNERYYRASYITECYGTMTTGAQIKSDLKAITATGDDSKGNQIGASPDKANSAKERRMRKLKKLFFPVILPCIVLLPILLIGFFFVGRKYFIFKEEAKKRQSIIEEEKKITATLNSTIYGKGGSNEKHRASPEDEDYYVEEEEYSKKYYTSTDDGGGTGTGKSSSRYKQGKSGLLATTMYGTPGKSLPEFKESFDYSDFMGHDDVTIEKMLNINPDHKSNNN